MTSALTLITAWQVNVIAVAAGVASAGWYTIMVRRLTSSGRAWSQTRSILFYAGIASYLWCTNGFLNVYSDTLLWTWTIQVLALLLVVPVLLMAGQPIELAATTARRRSLLHSAANSRVATFLAYPFVGTALVPILTAVLFFGHVGDLWNADPWIPAMIGVALIGIGCLIARKLTFEDLSVTSLTVAVTLAVSVVELLTDAVPGIVLRFTSNLQTGQGRRDDRHQNVEGSDPGAGPSPSDQPWWLTDPRLADRPGIGSGQNRFRA